MKDYELTVLINPDLEKDLDKVVGKIKKLVTDNGGEVKKEESEGKKKLAYLIAKQEFAVFHFFELSLPAEAPLKINGTLNITDGVLRYLLVKRDEKLAAALAKKDSSDEEHENSKDNEGKE